MIRQVIPAFAALIAISQPASAGVPLFGQVSCAVVRFYVAKYSEATAEKWARSHGASEAEIETARHCLHKTDVQTASLAAKPQVVAPVAVAEHDATQPKPDERGQNPGIQLVSVEAQRASPEQDAHDERSKAGVRDVIRPENIEERSSAHVSDEIKREPVPSDGKTVTLRPRNASAAHRAYSSGATGWLKRLWVRLTRPRLTLAALHLGAGRR